MSREELGMFAHDRIVAFTVAALAMEQELEILPSFSGFF
jgi:hypothetical protein